MIDWSLLLVHKAFKIQHIVDNVQETSHAVESNISKGNGSSCYIISSWHVKQHLTYKDVKKEESFQEICSEYVEFVFGERASIK